MKRVEVDEINPILVILIAAIATSFIFLSCFELRTINDSSMSPTLVEGQRIVVFRLAYGYRLPFARHDPIFNWGEVVRNEIIMFAHPETGVELVKRCVAVAGDRIEISANGRFAITNESDANDSASNERVGKGFIYVAGDHPESSVDSRHFGPIPVDSVRGKVIFLR